MLPSISIFLTSPLAEYALYTSEIKSILILYSFVLVELESNVRLLFPGIGGVVALKSTEIGVSAEGAPLLFYDSQKILQILQFKPRRKHSLPVGS